MLQEKREAPTGEEAAWQPASGLKGWVGVGTGLHLLPDRTIGIHRDLSASYTCDRPCCSE